MKSKTKFIHVNQHVIRNNAKTNCTEPPLILRSKNTRVKPEYASRIDLVYNNEIIGSFIYNPNKPLACGAKVYFKSDCLQYVVYNETLS